MFADPIAVDAHSPTPALSFALVDAGTLSSQRLDVANGYTLNVNHSRSTSSGEKHYMQIQIQVSATNPLTGGTSLQTGSASISANFPAFGFTQAAKAALVQALWDTLNDDQVTIAKWLTYQS